MSNENSNSKNSPENKKRSWHKEPWYKRLFDKILNNFIGTPTAITMVKANV